MKQVLNTSMHFLSHVLFVYFVLFAVATQALFAADIVVRGTVYPSQRLYKKGIEVVCLASPKSLSGKRDVIVVDKAVTDQNGSFEFKVSDRYSDSVDDYSFQAVAIPSKSTCLSTDEFNLPKYFTSNSITESLSLKVDEPDEIKLIFVDAHGDPIEGVEFANYYNSVDSFSNIDLASIQSLTLPLSDVNGVLTIPWLTRQASNLNRTSLTFTHKDYATTFMTVANAIKNSKIELRRGTKITCKVVDHTEHRREPERLFVSASNGHSATEGFHWYVVADSNGVVEFNVDWNFDHSRHGGGQCEYRVYPNGTNGLSYPKSIDLKPTDTNIQFHYYPVQTIYGFAVDRDSGSPLVNRRVTAQVSGDVVMSFETSTSYDGYFDFPIAVAGDAVTFQLESLDNDASIEQTIPVTELANAIMLAGKASGYDALEFTGEYDARSSHLIVSKGIRETALLYSPEQPKSPRTSLSLYSDEYYFDAMRPIYGERGRQRISREQPNEIQLSKEVVIYGQFRDQVGLPQYDKHFSVHSDKEYMSRKHLSPLGPRTDSQGGFLIGGLTPNVEYTLGPIGGTNRRNWSAETHGDFDLGSFVVPEPSKNQGFSRDYVVDEWLSELRTSAQQTQGEWLLLATFDKNDLWMTNLITKLKIADELYGRKGLHVVLILTGEPLDVDQIKKQLELRTCNFAVGIDYERRSFEPIGYGIKLFAPNEAFVMLNGDHILLELRNQLIFQQLLPAEKRLKTRDLNTVDRLPK